MKFARLTRWVAWGTLAVIAIFPTTHATLAAEPRSAAIFTMKPDGSDVELFIALPGKVWNGSPTFSPDGTKVAFDASTELKGGPASHIFVTSVKSPLGTVEDLGLGNCPAWSPDGAQIIFDVQARNPAKAKVGVWTMNSDGTDRKWLCEGERGRWSPDGTRIAVRSSHEGFPSLYVVTPRFRKRILHEDYERVVGAIWSPDSSKLAFIGQRNGQSELAIVSAKGEDDSFSVRWRGNIGWQPSWSPDGKQILLWVKDEAGAERLHLISSTGDDGPQEIPGQGGTSFNSDATWSPDGARIIFASDRPTSDSL
jgi:Tol biopolymer transport system component